MEWGTKMAESGPVRAEAGGSRCSPAFMVVLCWCSMSIGLSSGGSVGGSAVLNILSFPRSLSVPCHSRAPVAVVDASPHSNHAVHAGIIRCCHLHAARAAETADDLD